MPAALAYLICTLIWGSTWIAIKYQIGVVPESVSLVYRFGLAAVILLAYVLIRRQNIVYPRKLHLWLAGLGATMFCFNYLLTYLSAHYLNSGLMAVVFSVSAVFGVLNAGLFLKEKISLRLWVGAIIGTIGIYILFRHKVGAVEYAQGIVLGFVFALTASYLSSVGNMIIVQLQKNQVPTLQANLWGMMYGVAMQVIVVLLSGERFVFDSAMPYVVSLLYLTLFGSVIAFALWFMLIRKIGIARAGYMGLATPIIALLISTFFENFEWTLEKMAGVTIVLLGKALVMTKPEQMLWLRQKLAEKFN